MKRMHLLPLVLLLALVAAVVGGCGISDPYAETSGKREAAPPDTERMKPMPSDPEAGKPPARVVFTTPQATLRYAANVAENWKGTGAAARAFTKLAGLSTGPARGKFKELAAAAELDPEAAIGYTSTEASVQAVSVKGQGGFREAIVVTNRKVASSRLDHLPAEYEVILATVTRWGKGWAISSWEPQP